MCARFRSANDAELLLELSSLLAEKPERVSLERISSIKVSPDCRDFFPCRRAPFACPLLVHCPQCSDPATKYI